MPVTPPKSNQPGSVVVRVPLPKPVGSPPPNRSASRKPATTAPASPQLPSSRSYILPL